MDLSIPLNQDKRINQDKLIHQALMEHNKEPKLESTSNKVLVRIQLTDDQNRTSISGKMNQQLAIQLKEGFESKFNYQVKIIHEG